MNTSLSKLGVDKSFSSPRKRRLRRVAKTLGWIAGVVLAVFALVAATASLLLNSQHFHNYVLNKAEDEAEQALGVKVTLQNFTLHVSTLSLDLWGLTVNGASPYQAPPLLQVDHAEVGIGIVSLIRRQWYLNSLAINRPIVRVFVDKNGVSNIPTFKSSGKNNNTTTVFYLGVRHALLDRGEIYYNDRHSALDADLQSLELHSKFDSSALKYSGSVAYSNGHLISGSLMPILHDLVAQFDATPANFHLRYAKLTSGASQVTLRATVDNYSKPSATVHYDASLDGAQFGKILQSDYVPTGVLDASGDVSYIALSGRPLIDALQVDGTVTSNLLDVHVRSVRARVTNISGHYSLSHGNALLQSFRASLLGGELTAEGTMSNLAGDSNSEVEAELRGISLTQLKTLASSSAAPRDISLKGILNAQAQASWGTTVKDLVAHIDATIGGDVSRGNAVSTSLSAANEKTFPKYIPIEGAIHGTYSAQDQRIALDKSYVRTPETSLTLDGVLGIRSSIAVRLQADDLREVETVADLVRTPAVGQSLQPLGLQGTASFEGTVRGAASSPELLGQLIASNLHLNGTEWKVLRTSIDASPLHVSLRHGDLEPASRGHIRIDASAGLSQWIFTNSSPVEVNLDAVQLNVADLTKLTGQQPPVTGTLNANVKMHGTQLNPQGRGNVTLSAVTVYQQPIQTLRLDFTGDGEQVQGSLNAALPTGTLESKFTIQPKFKTYSAQLSASEIHLDKLQVLIANNVNAVGVLSLSATSHGSFNDPGLDATLQIPQMVIQEQTIRGINLHATVANHLAIATLVASAMNTPVRANARINLDGDYLADASLETQSIPLQPLFAIYAPAQAPQLGGQTEIHATLHGPLKKRNLLEAHVSIPVLKMNYSSTIQLAETNPIHIDLKDGVVSIQRSGIRGTDTDIQFQGSITTASIGNMSLQVTGSVNLELAQLLEPSIRSSGQLKLNINSIGAANASDLGGEIDIVDANYASGDLPFGLSHGNGVIKLTKTRLNISSFKGNVGGGTLTAQGGVSYSPSLQFDLGLNAQGIRMLYPQGVRESVDANVRLAGTSENSVLGGSVNISELSFTPAFDLNSFIGQLSGGVAGPPSRGVAQNIQLNLAVRSSNDINLVSRTLSIGGSANLQVRGTAANPVILGRVNLNSGDIILNGNRFLLSGGTIQFVNPSATEPVINVSLNTNIQQYSIYLRFNGPASQLRTDYSSDPALPAADIINLLAFGQTTEASSANPSTPANQEAESLIASQVSSQVTSRFAKVAGISQLSISPVLGGSSNQGNPGANITIQQRVTGNLFVTFSSNVGSTQSQTIQGQYQLSPKVAVSATRDQNGGFAFDALIKKSW